MKTAYTRRLAAFALTLGSALVAGAPALAAKPYPDRPVTLVVGYAAGGATDIVARLMAKSLSEALGQTFVVENKTGANSNIGAEIVSRATPDGYTLYVGSIANTINRSLYSQLNYDFIKDFKPVGLVATIPNILVVNPKVPVKTVQEYIAYARAHPGKLTCASSGSGSSIHLSCELFKMETGTDILHVPYRGSGPAVADLLGGQVDSMFDNLPSSLPHVQAGKLRAIGVTSPQRLPATPDVPTLAESGLPGFDVESWFGLVAPAGTPQPVIARLNEALNQALASPALQASYKQAGFYAPTTPNTPETFAKKIDSEIDKWAAVVKRADIKAN
ncbi:tripartite tricarboxylate transporter substrate binding protein [Achromobacter sp. LC458]|uniref:Tripartite tricarboxylate transporter substrate binding protein n=1 Tax=Achromobacter spanius TaxID=217203 RepID=A0A2S5GXL4_9BURK|nr:MULTISPECIES: tripartite tricarboxylate transporter substrate binding protein [Achromobacter]AYD66932.1 tripartite tricarboxylate transporter substrate binding protein [Achromobacter sp. B7]MDX3985181.1 tripartite tricarboxylate transporter substrate binding protein [Achromobacter sp.]PPA77738.1 tripartite tricarboxylate transporter substrate binding protein [Achromobacter spanius]QYJ21193.1 tripartite tricarboxylate transporter substrate binding protein [Achromobacter sp. ES-001]TRM54022.1